MLLQFVSGGDDEVLGEYGQHVRGREGGDRLDRLVHGQGASQDKSVDQEGLVRVGIAARYWIWKRSYKLQVSF